MAAVPSAVFKGNSHVLAKTRHPGWKVTEGKALDVEKEK